MQFLYDNLTATVIALTTLLLLFSIQSRATQNNVAQTSRNVMEEYAQTFATWLEKDLQRMGENMDRDDPVPYENPQTVELENGMEVTTRFIFYRDSTSSDDDEEEKRVSMRYDVEEAGTRTVDGESKTLYKLTRKVKIEGEGWSSVQGESTADLGYFKIDLLDKDANPVDSPKQNEDQVHSVRVRFSVVSPFQNAQTFPTATHVGSVLLLRKEEDTGESSDPDVPEHWFDCQSGAWQSLTDDSGSDFGCAAECIHFATDGHRGSNNCGGGGWGWGWWY